MSAGEPGIVRGGIHVRRSQNRVAGGGPIANECYSHLGGRLGKALMEHILKQGWLEPVEGKRFRLTHKGRKGLRAWGIDPEAIEAEGRKGWGDTGPIPWGAEESWRNNRV